MLCQCPVLLGSSQDEEWERGGNPAKDWIRYLKQGGAEKIGCQFFPISCNKEDGGGELMGAGMSCPRLPSGANIITGLKLNRR